MRQLKTIALFALFLFSTSLCRSQTPSLTDSLIAVYQFNGNALDSTSNHNDGTLNGTSPTTDRFGNANGALTFNGTSDYIDIKSTKKFKPTSFPISVCAWVRYTGITGSDGQRSGTVFMNDFVVDNYYGIIFNITGATNVVALSFGDGTAIGTTGRETKIGTTNVGDGQWHFIAGVIRGAHDMDIYVDCKNDGGTYSGTGGTLVYEGSDGVSGRSDPCALGCNPFVYYKGDIDEIRFYHRELKPNDILRLYTISNNSLPTVSLGPDEALCQPGSIKLSPISVTQGVTFLWSNSSTSNNINVNSGGSYSITVTDAHGCKAADTIKLASHPIPTLTLTPITSICSGQSIQLFASSNASISWNTDNTLSCTQCSSPLATPPSTKKYYATSSDGTCSAQDSITVNVTPAVFLKASGNTSICLGNTSNLTVTGSQNIIWSPANTLTCSTCTNPTASPTVTTTYHVNGTGGTCIQGDSLVVVVNFTSVKISGKTIICNGIGTTLDAGSGYTSYHWSNGSTIEASVAIQSGRYYVTVTKNGCTGIDSVDITSDNLSANISSTNPTCISGGTINLTFPQGTPSVNVIWNNDSTSKKLSNLSAGNYSATITDVNQCNITEQATLSAPSPVQLSTQVTDASCGLSNGAINLTISSGTPSFQFNWSNGATIQNISNLAADFYSLIVTDANGCSGTASAIVSSSSSPIVTVPAKTICTGGSTSLIASGANTYTWTPGTGLSATTGTSVTANPSSTTTYTVIGTSSGGCTGLTTVIVMVNNLPVIIVRDTSICNGGNVTLSATGAITYSWSPGSGLSATTGSNVTAHPASTITYTITGTNLNQCSANATVVVTVNPAIQLSTTLTNVSCNGSNNGAINLTVSRGSPSFTYTWNNKASTEDLSSLVAGTYIVTVTDLNNCSASTNANITEPAILKDTISSFTNASGCGNGNNGTASVTVSGGTIPYSYSWDTNPIQNGSTATNLGVGNYSATVTDHNGCQAFTSVIITSSGTGGSLSFNPFPDTLTNCSSQVLDAGSWPSYKWSNGSTTETITANKSGTYSVTVTAAGGCVASDTVYVRIKGCEAPNIKVTSVTCNSISFLWNSEPCALSYKLQISSGNCNSWTSYSISAQTLQDIISGLHSNTKYYFRISTVCSSNSCSSSSWSSIGSITTSPACNICATPTGINLSQSSDNCINIRWNDSESSSGYQIRYKTDNSCNWNIAVINSGCNSYTLCGLKSCRSVTVEIRTICSNCPANYSNYSWDAMINLQHKGRNGCDRIDAADSSSFNIESINAYPNPFNDFVKLDVISNANQNVHIAIIDIMGRTIKIKNDVVIEGMNTLQLETDGLPEGTYFVELLMNNKTFTTRIIK